MTVEQRCAPIYAKLEEKFGPQPTKNFQNIEDLAMFLHGTGWELMIALGRKQNCLDMIMAQMRRIRGWLQ